MDSKNFWMLPAVLPLALAIASSAGAGNPATNADPKNTQLRTPKKATYSVETMDDGAPGVQASRTAAWLRGTKGLPIVRGNRNASPRGSSGVDTLERIDYSYISGNVAGGPDAIASDASIRPNISADGAFSVFTSLAQNLTADDALGFSQCYRVNNTTGAIVMVSKTAANGPGNGGTGLPTFKGVSVLASSLFVNGISGDGNLVSFTSEADNLVTGDTNGVSDVFVTNMTTGVVTRVSVTTAGAQLTGASWDGMISGNGNFVAFTSLDMAGNTAGFVADPEVALTNSLTGRQIGSNVFVRNISGATTTLVSNAFGTPGTGANSDSRHASISDAGTRICYESRALNLLATPKTTSGPAFGNAAALTSIYQWDSGTGVNFMVDQENDPLSPDPINANLVDSWGPSISRNGRFVIYTSRKPLFASSGASRVICTDLNAATPRFTHRQMNTDATGAAAFPDAGYRFGWNSWISDDGLLAIMTNKPISADGFGDWDQVRAKVTATDTTTVSVTAFQINTAVGGALPDSGIYRWGSGNDRGQASRAVMSSDKTKFVFVNNSTVLDGQTGGLANVYLGTVDGTMTVTAMRRISRGTTNGGTVAFEDDSKEHESNFVMPAISPNGKYVVYVGRDPSPLEAMPFASRPWNAGGYFTGVNDEQMYRVDTETGDWALASFGVDFAGSGAIYPLGLGDPSTGIGNLYSFDNGLGYTVASGNFPIQDFAAEQNNEVAWFDLAYGFGSSHIYELGFGASVANNGEVAFWNPGYNDAPDGPLALSWAPLDSYFLYVNDPSAGTSEAVLANGGDFIRNTTSHIVPFTERTHISADGRYLGFTSDGLDIVLPDDNLGLSRQAYVYDRNTNTNRLVARRRDVGTGLATTGEITGGESFLLGLSSDGQKALWVDVSAGNIFDPSFTPDSIGQLFLFNDAASGASNDGAGTMQCVSTTDTGAAVADTAGTPFTGLFSGVSMSSGGDLVAFLGQIDLTTATGEAGPAVGVQAYRKTVGANSGTGVLGALTLLSKASGAPFVDGTDGINTLNMSSDGSQIVFPSDVAAGFSTNPSIDANGAQWDVFRLAGFFDVFIDSIHPTNGQTDIGTSLPAAVSQRGSTTKVVFNSDADTVFNAGSASMNNHLWLHTYSVAAADSGSWTMYE